MIADVCLDSPWKAVQPAQEHSTVSPREDLGQRNTKNGLGMLQEFCEELCITEL